jgi:hypothetical protein
MHKQGWLLHRLQTGSFAVLILCGLTYLVAQWLSPPKAMPNTLFDDVNHGYTGYFTDGKITEPFPPPGVQYTAQHPFASHSAFAYTMAVFVCMALMVLAGLALGWILAARNRKAHGIIGWIAVMVGAWSVVLLTARGLTWPCPAYLVPGSTCSLASQAAAHWAIGLLPLAFLLTVLPTIAAFSTRRMLVKPAASSASKQDAFV